MQFVLEIYFFCFMFVCYHKNSLDFFITDKFIMRHGMYKEKKNIALFTFCCFEKNDKYDNCHIFQHTLLLNRHCHYDCAQYFCHVSEHMSQMRVAKFLIIDPYCAVCIYFWPLMLTSIQTNLHPSKKRFCAIHKGTRM